MLKKESKVGCWFCVVVFCLSTVAVFAEDKVLFQDDFDSYNVKNWGSKPAHSITLKDGMLIDKPKRGQVFLASIKKFRNVTLEARLKFNNIGPNIFYYLGFQSVKPWVYDMCWITIQDSSVSANTRKAGQESLPQQAGYVESNKWYVLKIVREKTKVEFFLNDKLIAETENPDFIPDAKMPIFLSANTLKDEQGLAELEIDWVRITGEIEKAKKTAKKKESAFSFSTQLGRPEAGIIKVTPGKILMENDHYICQLSFADGLKWDRVFNKDTDKSYLFEDDNCAIFKVFWKKRMLESTDFDFKNINLWEENGSRILQIDLRYPKYKLEAVLKILSDKSQQSLWSLKFKNNSDNAVKLQPIFPLLGRLAIAGNLEETRYFFPWRGGIVGKIDCELMYEYGCLAWMQVISVFNQDLETGIYTYPEDSTGGFKGLTIKKSTANPKDIIRHNELLQHLEVPKADVFDFEQGLGFAYYYPGKQIPAGGEYSLPKTVISIYQGTWKEPLKDYSRWVHTWYKPLDRPQWIMNCFSFLPRHEKGFYSEKEKRYIASDFTTPATHIQQWAYWQNYPVDANGNRAGGTGLNKTRAGEFGYSQHRGGLKTFKEEVQKIQAKGTRFSIYYDHRFLCSETEIAKKHGKEWAAMSEPGTYLDLGIYGRTGIDGWSECFYEPNAWADYVAQNCGRIVRETGMDCIYLDELPLLFPCYNDEHLHYRQDQMGFSIERMQQHMTKARDAMRAENPEAVLMTEHAGSDYFTQFIDCSWVQTFYPQGFPFAAKYFDENSLHYFRFCFPEFKLAAWYDDDCVGQTEYRSNRCLFNGIGRFGLQGRAAQVMKENGDAFASLKPEPLVETKIRNVLANKFPTAGKTVYTIYNKTEKAIDKEIIEVDSKKGYHFVEMLYDNDIKSTLAPAESKEVLKLQIKSNDVVCVGQLPQILQTKQQGKKLMISLNRDVKNATLAAFLNEDTSHFGLKDAKIIALKNGRAVVNPRKLFGGSGKLILKLFQGEILLDEMIVQAK